MRLLLHIVSLSLILTLFTGCKKDTIIIPDNQAPTDNHVPRVAVQNYVNRLYIDLLGREPLNTEMQQDVQLLLDNDLAEQTRIDIVTKLQTDETFIEGDSSYKIAYYNRFYDIAKVRMVEGVEDAFLAEDLSNMLTNLDGAIAAGDSAEAALISKEIQEVYDFWGIRLAYRNGEIGIEEVYYRLIDNYVYDLINMNTFNFINATFDNMYFRFPTETEYNAAFDMIEHDITGNILGMTGNDRGDYMHIVTHSNEFYEGLIRWQFRTLLQRDPNADEIVQLLPDLKNTSDFQAMQKQIMITDEYANF